MARRQPSGVARSSFPGDPRALGLIEEPPKAAKARADMGAPSPPASSSPDESDESSSSDEFRTIVGRRVDFRMIGDIQYDVIESRIGQ